MQIALIDTIELIVTEAAQALPSLRPHLFYDNKRVTMVCCMCAAECCLVQAVSCTGLCEIGLIEGDCFPLITIYFSKLVFTCESRLHVLHIESSNSHTQQVNVHIHLHLYTGLYMTLCLRDRLFIEKPHGLQISTRVGKT